MKPVTSATLTGLLVQLQQLQSEKDGIARPAPGNPRTIYAGRLSHHVIFLSRTGGISKERYRR